MHCNRKRLLRRGLEFHVCTINKSAHTKKVWETYLMILVSSDSFPIPSIETAGHELANMKHFAKIDLKSAYNHIEIDDRFKEITTLNTPMGLWRCSCLPFGIQTASKSHRENLIRKSGQHLHLSRRYMSSSLHQRKIKEYNRISPTVIKTGRYDNK